MQKPKHNKPARGIRRVLVGHPADPASTRELHGASALELMHIRLAMTAALLEERLYGFLPDTSLQAAVLLGGQYSGAVGMEVPPTHVIRSLKAEQAEALRSLEVRFATAGDSPVIGIPRHEFAALIEALQGGLQEAGLFLSLNAADAGRLYQKAKAIHVEMGIGDLDHYDQWADDLPDFFAGRMEVLSRVLCAINLPYDGVDYA